MPVSLDDASSTTDSILLVAIVIIVSALILAFLLGFLSFFQGDPAIPSPIAIYGVYHTHDLYPNAKSDSRVILINNSDIEYTNDDLMAVFLRNGEEVHACIDTLNGYHFIPTHHNGVQWMGGPGCQDLYFSPHEIIVIDFTDNTFIPGDQVTAQIYERCTGNCKKEVITFSLLDQKKVDNWVLRNVYHINADYALISQNEYSA
ncbi:MAG: hypothetical protein JXA44_01900 [Methanospirillaceae archaeon]|nr:hypothetical protein [Methanospirillaceae archaeon]